MDSLLISGRLHCQPSQQRGRSTIEGHPTRGCTTALPAAALRENARRGRSPPPTIGDHRRHGERSAPSREKHLKSPCLSTQRAARRRNLTHALTTLRPRLGPTYSVNDSSRDVWGSPMGVITLQIGKSWISPVGGLEGQIAPHHHFVQSVDCAVKKKEVHGWSDNHHSCARDDTSLTSFAKWGYLVEPARRAG